MKFKIGANHQNSFKANIYEAKLTSECPDCGKHAVLNPIVLDVDKQSRTAICIPDYYVFEHEHQPMMEYHRRAALRHCSNCDQIVLVVFDLIGDNKPRILQVFPPISEKMHTEGVSEMVIKLLNETLACYAAGCYRATCIMARRVIEEMCGEMGYTTGTLHQKLKQMADKGEIPQNIHAILNEVKLLGNDAAHVELRNFDDIQEEHAKSAVGIIKWILDHWFNESQTLSSLNALKKSQQNP